MKLDTVSGYPTYKSEARIDIALLASALFLQRFSVPFFHTRLSLDFVFATLIFVHQFSSEKVFIQYDRLLWFLVLLLTATSSLLLNFNSRMLTSYGLFVLVYFLFTLTHSSAPDQYKSMLQGFQLLVLILSCLGIAQFVAQFVVNAERLIMFYGIFPDFLLPPLDEAIANTLGRAGSLIKSNGLFLGEPSEMSQIAALGILIEVLEFRRPRYLVVFTLGLLLAYSGTGISILLFSLPLATLVNRRAQLPALLVGLLGFGLLATGIIHLSAFTSRVGEFDNTNASGFIRFVSPFWLAADYFHQASLTALLIGNGPSSTENFTWRELWFSGSGNTWFKLFYEYGLIGTFVFVCFLGSCFRRSRCPKPLFVALIYQYLVTSANLVGTSTLITIIVFCTLNGPESRRGRINEPGQYRSSHIAGPVIG